jgi:hypothetical protein
MTAVIVNLNKFRKARERAEAERQAEANCVRFGRTKSEREAVASEERAKDRVLDDAQLPARGIAVDDDLDPGSAS